MSHLVKPVSFRAGKTAVWPHNTVTLDKNSIINGTLLGSVGVERISKSLLRRKRLYVVRAISRGTQRGQSRCRLIYVPKIKTKPREHFVGAFLRRAIYKPFNFITEGSAVKSYVHRRKEKIAKITKRYKPRKLNRWLTKRMFRGAANFKWRRKSINKKFSTKVNTFRSLALQAALSSSAVISTKVQDTFINSRRGLLQTTIARHYADKNWKHRWPIDMIKIRRFNDKRFSMLLSKKLKKHLQIETINLFSYLVLKRLMTYKSHQNHFWNLAYRRYRFQYKNYFDIANAVLAMGLVDNSEVFLLSILRLTLPVILKIRRFFKFLNTVIKNMPEIIDKFLVFRLHIAGKLAGGTKRTKSHSVGYGTLPAQTLNFGVTNAFLAYRHIYGEFGVKLVTCKIPSYKAPIMLV